jgi:hypothetical protein
MFRSDCHAKKVDDSGYRCGRIYWAPLVKYLVKRGHVVRGADIKAPEYQRTDANEFVIADLRIIPNA